MASDIISLATTANHHKLMLILVAKMLVESGHVGVWVTLSSVTFRRNMTSTLGEVVSNRHGPIILGDARPEYPYCNNSE